MHKTLFGPIATKASGRSNTEITCSSAAERVIHDVHNSVHLQDT